MRHFTVTRKRKNRKAAERAHKIRVLRNRAARRERRLEDRARRRSLATTPGAPAPKRHAIPIDEWRARKAA